MMLTRPLLKNRTGVRSGLRSLLQKAVRRGHADRALATAKALEALGDTAWVRRRTDVIVFEECWRLGGQVRQTVGEDLVAIAKSVKQKDAAGLGTLALALTEGDRSALEVGDPRPVRIVAEAIRRPEDFWAWVESEARDDTAQRLVARARSAHRTRHWPWDRAFMQAAAFLAVNADKVKLPGLSEKPPLELPTWVALDRHTPTGKAALRMVAREFGYTLEVLSWASFYWEGATVNALEESGWWAREVEWRFASVGVTPEQGRSLWHRIRPHMAEILSNAANELDQAVADLTTANLFPHSSTSSI